MVRSHGVKSCSNSLPNPDRHSQHFRDYRMPANCISSDICLCPRRCRVWIFTLELYSSSLSGSSMGFAMQLRHHLRDRNSLSDLYSRLQCNHWISHDTAASQFRHSSCIATLSTQIGHIPASNKSYSSWHVWLAGKSTDHRAWRHRACILFFPSSASCYEH